MTYQAIPDSGTVETDPEYWKRRAVAFTGLALPNIPWEFDDMFGNWGNNTAPIGWEQTGVVGSGVGSVALTDESGGVAQLSTGATAASVIVNRKDGASIKRIDQNAWYLAVRIKLTTAVTANTKLYSGMIDMAGTKTVAPGFFGALSATNFVVQYDGNEAGSILNTGVAVDTNWHIFEVYTNIASLTTIRMRFDSGSEVSAVMSAAPTQSMMLYRAAYNGGDAVNRAIRTDWMAATVART